MKLRNSYVDRIVHLHDWPHAERVRSLWPTLGFDVGVVSRTFVKLHGVSVTMIAHVFRCSRCTSQQWRVWVPEGYAPRPCDAGPCPACDQWSAPNAVQHRTEGPSWNSALLRIGETVAWHHLADRELLEIARFEAYRAQSFRIGASIVGVLSSLMIDAFRKDLSFALTEAAYRNLLPAQDDLRVAFDLAWQTYGDAAEKLSFADLWCIAYDS